MAQITITYNDTLQTRVIDAFSLGNGWTANVENPDGSTSPNPLTKAQWARNEIKRYIREHVIQYEANRDAEAARTAAVATGNTDIVITVG